MTALTTLDFIDRAALAPSTKAKYRSAIDRAQRAGVDFQDTHALSIYAATLPESGQRLLKSAIHLWTKDIKRQVQAGSTPDTALAVMATKDRLEALNETIQVAQHKGQKAHTWLSQAEVKRLLASCNTRTIGGRRDKIVLGLLVGAGLRREELAALTFEAVLVKPVKDGKRTVLGISGKGKRNREIPLKAELATDLDAWSRSVGGGHVARSVTRGGQVGEALSAVGIFHIVRGYGPVVDKPTLAPHDLRRTYAQLGFEAGVPITQISRLLGHSSVTTTQRYLNVELNLVETVSDFVPYE
jgi:site-specific recombinase XerD